MITEWRGNEVFAAFKADAQRRVNACGNIVRERAKANVRTGGASGLNVVTGELYESIMSEPNPEHIANRVGVRYGMKHGRVHELGGILFMVHPRVTPKMRRWAWGMYARTGDGKYKGIATTRKLRLDVPAHPRPYLRPALDSSIPEILRQFSEGMIP